MDALITYLKKLEARIRILEANQGRYTFLSWSALREFNGEASDSEALCRAANRIAEQDGFEESLMLDEASGDLYAWPLEVWDEALRIVSAGTSTAP